MIQIQRIVVITMDVIGICLVFNKHAAGINKSERIWLVFIYDNHLKSNEVKQSKMQ